MKEENRKKRISAVSFIASGSILLLWFSLLYDQSLDKLPLPIFYLCSAVVGGVVFSLIWWALENLLLVICIRSKEKIDPKGSVPEKSEIPHTSVIHDARMEILIPETTLTQKERLLTLFSIVSGCLLLVDSAVTYHLTSSSPPSSWLPVLIQFFVFYGLFSMVFLVTYVKKGTEFPIKGKRIHAQVFAIKRKHKKLIVTLGALFLISTIFGELVAAKVVFNTQTPFGVIQGDSMLPTFREGDVLVIQGVNPENIRVGEVIAFSPPSAYESQYPPLIFHRVIDKMYTSDGKVLFQTKGDNSPSPEPFLVSAKNIYGVQRGLIPYIGWIFTFLRNPIGLTIILIVFAGIFAGNMLMRKILLRRKTEQQNSKVLKETSTAIHTKDHYT